LLFDWWLFASEPLRSFSQREECQGGGLSLLADLTQGGIVPLWTGESQQLFVLHAAMQSDMKGRDD